ncbi:MAG: twin-arginine translocase TatA/TatE family subunit [Desulfobulbaceae bacterium]|nr:twin-arginine translocase TatA/TatE family subunit [Desulfobulbaceae bacterium]
MLGIGLPELILILALALIVVGPDKLPEMAKTMAKHLMELKKTANALKENFQEEMADIERPGDSKARQIESESSADNIHDISSDSLTELKADMDENEEEEESGQEKQKNS